MSGRTETPIPVGVPGRTVEGGALVLMRETCMKCFTFESPKINLLKAVLNTQHSNHKMCCFLKSFLRFLCSELLKDFVFRTFIEASNCIQACFCFKLGSLGQKSLSVAWHMHEILKAASLLRLFYAFLLR